MHWFAPVAALDESDAFDCKEIKYHSYGKRK